MDRAEATPSHDSETWILPTSRHAADRYAALLDISFDLSCLLDSSGTVHYASPSVLGILGRTAEETAAVDILTCVHPDDAEGFRQLLEVVRTGHDPVRTRGRLRAADGTYRLIEAVAVNLLDDPQIAGIAMAGRDLTGEQVAGARRRSAEDELAVLLDNSPVIVFSLDPRASITSRTGRELTDLGIDPALTGRDVDLLLPADESGAAAATPSTRCLAGEDVDIVYELGGGCSTSATARCASAARSSASSGRRHRHLRAAAALRAAAGQRGPLALAGRAPVPMRRSSARRPRRDDHAS